MRRETAEHELLARLDAVGVRSGRIDLPAIWPALASWWRTPVSDVAPEDDERAFYLSRKPAETDPQTTTVFASTPPKSIADQDLVRIDFEREFSQRLDMNRRFGLEGGVVVSLWYEASPEWDPLRHDPDWIDMGISTPHFDWSADGRHVERVIADLEQSAVFQIAWRQHALAMEFVGEELDDLVVQKHPG